MRKWILNFIEIIIILILGLTFFLAVLQNTFLQNKSIFGYRSYVIASNSMYPVLEYGDVILIKDIDFNKIKVNDIITYMGEIGEFKGKVITHEVIEIMKNDKNETVLKTKGRANTGIDPSVYEKQIYGKLAYKFIIVSVISKIIRNKIGFFLLIFIPISILFILEFVNMIKESKRRELEKLVKNKLEELKKINNNSEKALEVEETIWVQLKEIKKGKRDFKKMKELEKTISIEKIEIEIEKLKKVNNIDENMLDKTIVLNNSDLKKEIMRELKLKNNIEKKKKNTKNKQKNKRK